MGWGQRTGRTVELEELVVAGLGGELLGVDDGLLEGFALGGRHGGVAAVVVLLGGR